MPVSAPHGTRVAARVRTGEPPSAGAPRRRNRSAWLLVAALTLAGAVLRVVAARQSLFGDELSTYWLVSTHGLSSMLTAIRDTIEITPPLSFVLSWLTTRPAVTPELLRLPALLAGIATIPLVWVLGARTVGRTPGLIAAAFVAFSPFLVFYSSEARNYSVLVLLIVLSTLALLEASESGRTRWWLAYAACSCLAMYAHYTAAFPLAAQLAWVLWAHPEARVRALLANAAAAAAFAPWVPGMLNDFDSPDTQLMKILTPFTGMQVRLTLEHWSIGYPLVQPTTELRDLPGVPALVLMALGLGLATVVGAGRLLRRPRVDRRVVLIVALALACPVGEAVVAGLGGPKLFAPRNLAGSWPGFALALAALLVAAGPRLRYVSVACVLAGFVAGGLLTLDSDHQRPHFADAAAYVDRHAAPADPVVDGAVFSFTPGPVTPMDATLERPHVTVRYGASERRDGNFGPYDRVLTQPQVIRKVTATRRPVFVVTPEVEGSRSVSGWDPLFARAAVPYRRTAQRRFGGYIRIAVLTYEPVR
jgi:hypothetical protein